MASLHHPTTMEKLPNDVLTNIFTRLLAKQLAQMRCISKPWNALVSEPLFIKSHLHHSIHKKDAILLVFIQGIFCFDFKPIALLSRSPTLQLTNFTRIPNLQKSINSNIVIGSVNGLICFSHRSDVGDHIDVNIWNPSLSAVLKLPQYSIMTSNCCKGSIIDIIFRFGFDPQTDDYKVIKLTSLFSRRLSRITEWLQVEVYSMRKGTCELIKQRFPSHVTSIVRQDEVCVDGHNGHLHWLGYIDEDKRVQRIVAFDLGVETFREITFPNSTIEMKVKHWNVIGVLAGKLCVMSWVKDGKCEVWVMDEYGVAESWVKHHAFSQFTNIVPIGFTLHNEFLFQQNDGVSLYDPVAAKVTPMNTMSRLYTCFVKIIQYVDSLVWVVPAQREINLSHFAKFKRGMSRMMMNGQRDPEVRTSTLLTLFVVTYMLLWYFNTYHVKY